MSLLGRAPLSSALANMRMRPSGASPGVATADDGSRQLETDWSVGKLERPRAGTAVAEARAPCPQTNRERIGSAAPKGPSSTVSFNSTWRASCSTCTTPRASACRSTWITSSGATSSAACSRAPDAAGEQVDTLKHRPRHASTWRSIVTIIAIRAIRWLEKHGYLRSEDDEDPAENADTTSPWMRCLQGSLGVGELQRWAEHGSPEQSRDPARRLSLPKPTKGLSAEHLKFNLHAGVSVPGGSARRTRTLAPLLCSPSPRARAALRARRRQDLLPDQGHRPSAADDTGTVPGTSCRIGAPTAPSVGAFLRSLGVAQPVAQPRGHSGSRANNARHLRSLHFERFMRIPGHIGGSHPHRRLRRDGACANSGWRQGPVSSASFEPEAPPPVRRSPA
jgi:hypothetical protein